MGGGTTAKPTMYEYAVISDNDDGDFFLDIWGTAEAGALIIVRHKGKPIGDTRAYEDGVWGCSLPIYLIDESLSITAQAEGKNVSQMEVALARISDEKYAEVNSLEGLMDIDWENYRLIYIDGNITLTPEQETQLSIPSDKVLIINSGATLSSGGQVIVNEGVIITEGVLRADTAGGLVNNNQIYVKSTGELAHATGGTLTSSKSYSEITIFEGGKISSASGVANFEASMPFTAAYLTEFRWDWGLHYWREGGLQ